MFPLIAIAAFFISAIAFFVIGKDDFGIKRVKEVSNDNSVKGKEVVNPGSSPNEESIEEKKDPVIAVSSSEIESVSNTSD
tara:strand:- start:118 stop:357 length:240 start_codon:yes stop_codon:yes gene_type:complete